MYFWAFQVSLSMLSDMINCDNTYLRLNKSLTMDLREACLVVRFALYVTVPPGLSNVSQTQVSAIGRRRHLTLTDFSVYPGER